jgi:hypothetical protein
MYIGCSANAGIAIATIIATIIAAMTNAADNNTRMRLINTAPFFSGAEEERYKTPAPVS